MSQGKGSQRRPSFIPQDEYGRRYTQTFTERELANDFREHHKRLIRVERRLAENKFPHRVDTAVENDAKA